MISCIENNKNNLLILFMLMIFSLPIWLVKYPPLTDYPSHLMSIHIAKEYNNQAFNFKDNFVVNFKPLPNLGSEVIIYLLSSFVSIKTAGKIYLNLFSVLLVISLFYFIGVINPKKTFLCIFGFLFFYNWYFHQGYLNFFGSLPILFFAFGYWLSSPQLGSLKEKIMAALLFTALYFFHFFSWLVLVVSLTFFVMLTRENLAKARNTLAALAPSGILSLYYFFVIRMGSSMKSTTIFFNPYDNIIFAINHTFNDFSKFDFLLYIIPLLLLTYFILKVNILQRNTQNTIERSLFWLVCFLSGLFFVLPMLTASVYPFNLRLNIFIIFFALATLSFECIKKFKKIIIISVAAFSFMILGNVFWQYQKMSSEIETYVSGIQYIQPNKNILPLSIDVSGGWKHKPLNSIWAYYHIEKGGAGPYLFNLPHGQIVNYRKPKGKTFPAPCLYPLNAEGYDPSKHSHPYDYVIQWGENFQVEQKLMQHFRLIFENGQLMLYEKLDTSPDKQFTR